MKEITRIRKASVIIFLLPLLAINLGLLFNNYISLYSIDNYKFIIFLYDKFPILERIHLDALEKHYLLTKPTFPYIDGEISISAAVRGYYVNYFIFKPLIFLCCVFMLLYWYNYKIFLNKVSQTKKQEISYFFVAGVASAFFSGVNPGSCWCSFSFSHFPRTSGTTTILEHMAPSVPVSRSALSRAVMRGNPA